MSTMRKSFSGNAPRTQLAAQLNDTTGPGGFIQVDSTQYYPSGSDPFVIVLGRGTAKEEKILCSGIANSTTFTIQQRGYDDTVAQTHNVDTYVHHVLDSVTVAEANEHANSTTKHLPPGGSDGMSLVKQSGADYDAAWQLVTGGEGGAQLISGGTAYRGVRVYRSAALSIGTATPQATPFDTEVFDTDGFHDNSTNNTRLTVPQGMSGKYLIQGALGYGSSSTGRRNANIVVNGSQHVHYTHESPVENPNPTIIPVATVVHLNAGDYVELFGYQDSGSTLNMTTGNNAAYLSMTYLDKSIGAGGMVGVTAKKNSSQGIANTTMTPLSFDQEDFDSDGFHDNSTNPERFTVPAGKSGKYLISTHVYFDALSDGPVGYVDIQKNGTTVIAGEQSAGSTGGTSQSVTAVADLNAGDYVTVRVWHNAGSSKDVVGGAPHLTKFNMVWLEGLYTPARPAGASYKGVRAYRFGTAQSIPHSQWTPVTFPSESFDTDGFHSTSSNTSAFIVPPGMGGKYFAEGAIVLEPNATGRRGAGIAVNGIIMVWNHVDNMGASLISAPAVSGVLDLNPGDIVELNALQESGGALNTGWSAEMPYFSLTYLDKSVGSGGNVGAKAKSSVNVSIPNNSNLTIPLNAEDYDTDSFHDNSTNNTRLTIPSGKSGKYLIVGQLLTQGSASGSIMARVYKNNSVNLGQQQFPLSSSGYVGAQAVTVADLVAGDYIELVAFQNSGSSLNTFAEDTWLSAVWLEGLTTDHGALTGLADDDHPQYAKKAGDTFTGQITANGGLFVGDGYGMQARGSAVMIASNAPQTYPEGLTVNYGVTGDGWPIAGMIMTMRGPGAHICSQVIYGTTGIGHQMRYATSATTWSAWGAI